MTTGIRDHVDPLTAMLYPAYTKRCDHCGGFVAHTSRAAAFQEVGDDVLGVQDAGDVVERDAVDREPAVRAGGDDAQDVADRGPALDRRQGP